MNPSVALVLVVWAAGAGAWAMGRALIGVRAERSVIAVAMLGVAVVAWLATGFIAWITDDPPARPWVFVGYAVTAAAVLPVVTPLAGRVHGRRGDLIRAVMFALLAFLCFRAESVFV